MASREPDATGALSRRSALAAIAGAGSVALAGCGALTQSAVDDGLSGSISIAGSSTVFPLMSAVAEEFQSEHGDVSIDVSSTGSGGGFSNFFCVGETQFNNASRPIKEEEQQLCEENGVSYTELTVATDALTVVVNNNNDFLGDPPCLTVEELAQIWESDAASTWSDVNSDWPDEPIDRYGAADTSGTYDYFIENIMGDRGHTSEYQATERDNDIAQGVSGSEYGIGYFGFAYFFQNPDQLQAVGVDNGSGCVQPSLDTAASGEYQPLSRGLYTYPKNSALADEHVAEFARYLLERAGNEELVANEVGYVPLTDSQQSEQQDKLESAIEEANS
jgi:phosphate transport system substrate-binding protein